MHALHHQKEEKEEERDKIWLISGLPEAAEAIGYPGLPDKLNRTPLEN